MKFGTMQKSVFVFLNINQNYSDERRNRIFCRFFDEILKLFSEVIVFYVLNKLIFFCSGGLSTFEKLISHEKKINFCHIFS